MDLEFEQFDVAEHGSLTGMIPDPTRLRGIYVLHFRDGEAYVGQTVDIWSRFTQHRRTYCDLQSLEFASVTPEADLDALERAEIQLRSESRVLRNVRHYLRPPTGPSPLDPIVPPEHQLQFRQGGGVPDRTDRNVDDAQRERGRRAFDRFVSHPEAGFALQLAAAYVASTIPVPRATERRFWAVSAAPTTNAGNRLFCFSVYSLETFVLLEHGEGEYSGFMNVSIAALEEAYGSLIDVAARLPFVEVDRDAGYEACGGNAVQLFFEDRDGLERLFNDPDCSDLLHAAADLNLRLMRKGPTLQGRWHNVLLADGIFHLLDEPGTEAPGRLDARSGSAGPVLPPAGQPNSDDIRGAVLAVIAQEGPVVGTRVHRACAGALGVTRVGSSFRSVVDACLSRAVRRGDIVSDAPLAEHRLADRTYRLPTQPPVEIRELGQREFGQIPPRELAAVLTRSAADATDPRGAARAAAAHYGISRLGSTVHRRIEEVRRLCDGETPSRS
ncbi:GIY-YIG nuclease family protein [Pseudonocardia spirodelae]|uniref:GIY-YIG nuclease family protein n=1 Tax=Pseudonocardia spirodelae TaxID=3133431 RepID=A0ABU8TA99_9PSEU